MKREPSHYYGAVKQIGTHNKAERRTNPRRTTLIGTTITALLNLVSQLALALSKVILRCKVVL